MGKLDDLLEEKVNFVGSGGGFGEPDAEAQHQREIDHLRFKISRRDNFKTAVISSLIGAVVAAAITLGINIFQ